MEILSKYSVFADVVQNVLIRSNCVNLIRGGGGGGGVIWGGWSFKERGVHWRVTAMWL